MMLIQMLKTTFETVESVEWKVIRGGTAYYPIGIYADKSEVVVFHSWDQAKEDKAKFIALAHNTMPLLLKAVDELEDATRELSYLKPEKFDDDEHRTNWESSLNRKLEVLAMLKGEVANG